MEEHDVVPAALQLRIFEAPEAIVDSANPLLSRDPSCILEGSRGHVEGVNLLREPGADRSPFESAETTAPGQTPGKPSRSRDPPKPIRGPFVFRAGDPAVDGLAAKRVRHPERRVLRLLPVRIPISGDLLPQIGHRAILRRAR